jgi:hypothetical protein
MENASKNMLNQSMHIEDRYVSYSSEFRAQQLADGWVQTESLIDGLDERLRTTVRETGCHQSTQVDNGEKLAHKFQSTETEHVGAHKRDEVDRRMQPLFEPKSFGTKGSCSSCNS